MPTNSHILTFAFLFLFSILSISGYAYEEFNSNPRLDTNITGYITYSENPIIASYNTTYKNKTGVMLLENGGTALNLSLIVQDDNANQTFLNTTNNTYFLEQFMDIDSDFYVDLPANKEGILYFNYLLNGTLASAPFFTLTHDEDLVTIIDNQTTLNTTPNVWHTAYAFVNASTNGQRENLYFRFAFNTTPVTLAINELQFISYDTAEYKTYWDTEANEIINYCGVNGSVWTYLNTDSRYNFDSAERGFLRCNSIFHTGADTYGGDIWVIRYENITVAQRQRGTGGTGFCGFYTTTNFNGYYVTKPCSGCSGGGTPYTATCTAGVMIQGFTLLQLKGVGFEAPIGTLDYTSDGVPPALYSNINFTTTLTTFDLLDYSNTTTPAGSNWKFTPTSDTYKPFFWATAITCEAKQICDPLTDFTYYQDINCNQLSPVWCSTWGCNDELTSCAYGDIGSFCLEDGRSYTTTDINGSTSFDTCYPQNCYQITETTVACADTAEEALESSNTAIQNALNVTAQSENLGEGIGIGAEAGKFLIGIVILLIIVIGSNALSYKFTKQTLNPQLNMVIGMLGLGFLTFAIPLFNEFIFIAIIIVFVVFLALKVRDNLGGNNGN